MRTKFIVEIIVGIFIILGILAIFFLAFKVSAFSEYSKNGSTIVYAKFEDIGDLKIRAPVKIAGVRIGEVSNIDLDSKSFQARVTLLVDKKDGLPTDSSASILAASLLGSNYIAITPGFSEEMLKDEGEITETHPAIILQKLIGQAIFTPKDDKR